MLENSQDIKLIFIALFSTIFLIIIAVVFLFIIFYSRKNKLIQQNLKAELINQKRQHEVELKALRSQMNPHFVYNSLNAIQYYIQKNDVETSEAYLTNFSKLVRQFFDFSRRKTVSIKEEIDLLENYLSIEKLRFEDKINYHIDIDDKLDIEEEHIPTMILQPIVENAINHGLFHKHKQGNLSLKFNLMSPNSFQVVITDDGIGIKASKNLKKNLTDKQNSHSSLVLEERIHFLNQSSNFTVDYSITDLSSKNINETGTRVVLTFNQDCNDKD